MKCLFCGGLGFINKGGAPSRDCVDCDGTGTRTAAQMRYQRTQYVDEKRSAEALSVAEAWKAADLPAVIAAIDARRDSVKAAGFVLHLAETIRGQYGQSAYLTFNYQIRK